MLFLNHYIVTLYIIRKEQHDLILIIMQFCTKQRAVQLECLCQRKLATVNCVQLELTKILRTALPVNFVRLTRTQRLMVLLISSNAKVDTIKSVDEYLVGPHDYDPIESVRLG